MTGRVDKHPKTVSELLDSLRKLREANPKAVRPTVHLYPTSIYAPEEDGQASSSSAPADPRRITSWKMTEHMYFQSNNNFPTLARGLFTEEVDGEERIVARGYDKFFNTDEVAWSYVSTMPTCSSFYETLTHPVGWDETSYSGPIPPHFEI
jgi:tRNA ligase